MEYTFGGECADSIEPAGDELTDGMSLGLGDEALGCMAMTQE